MTKIVGIEVSDVRFPTSQQLDGSDAMNPDPDYSATYVRLLTDDRSGLEGYGFTFTIGRGNELCVEACHSLAPLIVGTELAEMRANPRLIWDQIVNDSQLRWVGPEKGVVHLATAAVVNASWDLLARQAGKPVWKLLVDMDPAEIVSMVDFRYIDDALSPDQAMELLERRVPGKAAREAEVRETGLQAYTTSAGWLGYDDDKMRRLCREALADGFQHIKIKVGANLEDDLRRGGIIREEIGWERSLMLDANQRWGVEESIENIRRFASLDPLWIEEPTSPDDVVGHARIAAESAPIGIATGEMVQNRIMFKQLLQLNALRVLQVDSCRLGGLNEVVAVLLLAAQYGVPVVPHGGGVGLCEYVQHISAFDAICVAADPDQVLVEYVDHLHEHFVDPVRIKNAHYLLPDAPGYSAQMLSESVKAYEFPNGSAWSPARA